MGRIQRVRQDDAAKWEIYQKLFPHSRAKVAVFHVTTTRCLQKRYLRLPEARATLRNDFATREYVGARGTNDEGGHCDRNAYGR